MTDSARLSERPLPSSPETERAVLGAVILDNGLIGQAIELLKPEDFYIPSHRRIFLAMIILFEHGTEINPILIAEELRRDDALEGVGGMSFLTNLTYGLPHVTGISNYAKVIRGKSLSRKMVKTANAIINEALEEQDDPEVILNHAQQQIFELGSDTMERRTLGAKEIVAQAVTRLESFSSHSDSKSPAIPTPWHAVNNLCRGGIYDSELWGIAALVKNGKSALMKQWAQNLILGGRRILIFTREMSEVKILFRMLAALTDIPASQIRYGLDDARIARLIKSTELLKNTGLFINSKTSNIDEYRSICREMIRLEGVEIVFGDYLQLFKSGKKTDSRATEIGSVWRGMKDTAQDLDTRVVALAQFSREGYKVDRPYFHQVEGSGEGEKAVDMGSVLWTELSKGESGARPATLFIDYQRDEDAGTKADLIFDGRIMEFHEPGRSDHHLDFNN